MAVLARRFEGPRHARPGEGAGLLRFLDRTFSRGAPQGMAALYPHLYADIEAHLDSTHVIAHRGTIVAHLGIYPLEFVIPGGRVRVGGIGAVATHPRFRGQGLMSALLEHATGWMRSHGMPLSILWGDRRRYARFGWEVSGARLALSLTPRTAKPLARWDLPVSPLLDPRAVAGELQSLHRTMAVRVERPAADFPLILIRGGRSVFVAKDHRRIVAYAVARQWTSGRRITWSVEEAAGAKDGILGLYRWFATRPGVEEIKGELPMRYHGHFPELIEGAERWSTSIQSLGQLKVLDLGATLRRLGVGALVPAVRAARPGALDQPRLLFGPLPPVALLPPGPRCNRLAGRLPLPLYLAPADHV